MNELVDHYLGFPERDWVAAFGEWNDKRLAGGVAALDPATAGEHGHTTPSLPLAPYAGRYAARWYGPTSIHHDDQPNAQPNESLQSPNHTGPVESSPFNPSIPTSTPPPN